MVTEGSYRLSCPTCGSAIHVDDPMKRTLLETGCVVCQETLSIDDFDRV